MPGCLRWSAAVVLSLGLAAAPAQTPPGPSPAGQHVYPINLATALQLGDARSLDVALAGQRVQVALAQQRQAAVLWLPTVQFGVDYFQHDGLQQNTTATVVGNDRGTFLAGVGTNTVFAVSDALFAPLAARQAVRARLAERQAASNDTLLAVAEAYFNVQQARGDLAGAEYQVRQAEDLAARTEELARGLAPPLEATRARVELARRRQAVSVARERWRTAAAELARLLRLEPGVLIDPLEPPDLTVTLVHPAWCVDDLIPIALTNRPELAARQALVQATLDRLRQEKLRPLVPSVLLRGAATNPAGTLGAGVFGGGAVGQATVFGGRSDWDVQLLWEFQNLGLGNRARVEERKADHQAALLEVFRVQDRVAAEVAQAHAQLQSAVERLPPAEAALRDAVDLVAKSFEGLQFRRVGEANVLIVRPQEAVAALQALAQATADYYAAVGDHNRAQFRLYRALGHPAQCVTSGVVPVG